MSGLKQPSIVKKARRRVSMRSALLLTLCACLLVTAGRIVLLMIPPALRPLPEMLLTVLAFGGGAYLGFCVMDGDQRKTLVLSPLSRAQILYLSLLGALCVCPATLLSDLWRSLFAPGVSAETSGMAPSGGAAAFILVLVKSALAAPVCEELFFRGYLLCSMKRYGSVRAVAVTSLCFALAHGVSVGSLLVHALLGALLGAMMLKNRSVLAPMLVHGCYNALIVLIDYAGLAPMFDRISLVSGALRLLGCAAFAAVLKRAYLCPAEGGRLALNRAICLNRKEKALIAAALFAAVASAVITGVLS